MPTILILQNRFYEAQEILRKARAENRKDVPRNAKGQLQANPKLAPLLNTHHLYIRKKKGRLARQKLMAENPVFIEVFAWIKDLQKRLKVSKKKFAKLVGVTEQVIHLWDNYNKGHGGHFPSKKSFLRLIQLEKMASAQIVETFNKTNIVSKRNPGYKIRPKISKRIKRVA